MNTIKTPLQLLKPKLKLNRMVHCNLFLICPRVCCVKKFESLFIVFVYRDSEIQLLSSKLGFVG